MDLIYLRYGMCGTTESVVALNGQLSEGSNVYISYNLQGCSGKGTYFNNESHLLKNQKSL